MQDNVPPVVAPVPNQMRPQPTPPAFQEQVTPAAPVATASVATEVPAEYASFWQRFVASFVDGLLIIFVSFFLIFILGGIFKPLREGSGLANILGFPILLIAWAYHVYMVGKYGATLGKMAVHIKVIDENYQIPTFGKAGLREIIGKFVSGIIPLFIGYLWMFVGR